MNESFKQGLIREYKAKGPLSLAVEACACLLFAGLSFAAIYLLPELGVVLGVY